MSDKEDSKSYDTYRQYSVKGYWFGTNDYIQANNLESAGLYVKGNRMALLLHYPQKIAIQVYKIHYDWIGPTGRIEMMFGDGDSLFGDGPVHFERIKQVMKIKSKETGKILFKGLIIPDKS